MSGSRLHIEFSIPRPSLSAHLGRAGSSDACSSVEPDCRRASLLVYPQRDLEPFAGETEPGSEWKMQAAHAGGVWADYHLAHS